MTENKRKDRKNKKKPEFFKKFPPSENEPESAVSTAPKRTISGKVYLKRTALFWFVFILTAIGGLWAESTYFAESYPKMALAAGAVFFFTGVIYSAALYYLNGRCGILAEYAVGAGIRSGIPLFSALVIFLIFDNILPRCSVITLAVFYLFLTPFEVWMTLPENSLLFSLKVSSENTTGRKREEGRIR